MKILKIKLKQHTPLIHFQHHEEGATLRATEVKPKLDKFILQKSGISTDTEKPAILNYKMEIECIGKREEYLIASFLNTKNKAQLEKYQIKYIANSPYFAQEKENREIFYQNTIRKWNEIPRKGILHEGAMIVILGKEETIELIIKHVQSFFISNNFGTRNNKGFGSFSVSRIEISTQDGFKEVPLRNNEQLLKECFLFCYKCKTRYTDFSSMFGQINLTYKSIKSGISHPKNKKSYLMSYFYNQNIRWEKKYFKQNIKEKKLLNENGRPYTLKSQYKPDLYNDNGDFRFARAVLGLPNQYEFILENPPQNNPKNKLIITVKGEEGIERFKSPLFFKVIDQYIYLAGNTVSDAILNKQFNFTVNIQESQYTDETISGLKSPETFNLQKFMEYAMKKDEQYQKIK